MIVAVLAVTGALTMAMGALNFGLFIKPMGDELGRAGDLRLGAVSAPDHERTHRAAGWPADRPVRGAGDAGGRGGPLLRRWSAWG